MKQNSCYVGEMITFGAASDKTFRQYHDISLSVNETLLVIWYIESDNRMAKI